MFDKRGNVPQPKSYIKKLLEHWHDFRLKLIFEGILTGAFAGVVVVCFRLMLAWTGTERPRLFAFLRSSDFGWTALGFGCLIVISLILARAIKMVPMSTGSGIPQVKGILSGHLRMEWFKVIGAKFIGGLLGIGAGLSLGREGPSVQLGAAAGQGVSRLLRRSSMEEKYLLTSGASAGLSAAFNAPLAGVVFALEELHKNFSPVVLASAVAASVTANVVTRFVFGQGPVFDFHNIPIMPFHYYLYVVVLGLIVGAFGVLFNSSLVNFQIFYEKIHLPSQLKPAIPLLAAGVLGFVLPEVLGGGDGLINSLPQMHYAMTMLMVILASKYLFTMLSYGTGVPGGIFMPLLTIGALSGNVYGSIVAQYLHVDPTYVSNFIILAMAAYFSAIVKAPITGSILIMEMTGNMEQLLPLITVCMAAYIASDVLNGKPIYDVLLNRILSNRKSAKNTSPQKHDHDDEKHILEKVVSLGAPVCNRKIYDIELPENSVLVGIRRGDSEFIPTPDTTIYPGDYLIVMSGSAVFSSVHTCLEELASEEKSVN